MKKLRHLAVYVRGHTVQAVFLFLALQTLRSVSKASLQVGRESQECARDGRAGPID